MTQQMDPEKINAVKLDQGDGTTRALGGVGDALKSNEQGQIGGERNTSSSTNNYDAIHEEINYTRFAPGATTETVISNAPCFVYGWIGITGTGTLTLRDAAAVGGGSNPPFGTPALAVAGLVSLPGGVRFENGLTAQLGTGTDVCTIFWRAI